MVKDKKASKSPKKPIVRKLKWISGWSIGVESLAMIKRWPKIFVGLTSLYVVVAWLFAGGASQETYLLFKESLNEFVGSSANVFSKVTSLFAITASGSLDQSEDTLQSFLSGFLLLAFWITLIWAARYLLAKKPIRIRDALYNGTAPLVSSLLTLLVIFVQALPAGLMIALYTMATETGIVSGPVETGFLIIPTLLFSLLSLYWIAGSALGLVIVTLPGMYPLKALKASRELVQGQRAQLVAQLVWLVLWIVTISIIVLIPLLILDNVVNVEALPLIPIAAQVLGGFSILFSALYSYRLYRTLL